MSVAYRDRDRYDDSRTTISSSRRDGGGGGGGGGGYTTVKRYVVKDEDSRSSVGRRFVPERPGERVEETRIVRRERDVEEPARDSRRDETKYSTEELVIGRRDRDGRDLGRDLAYPPRREVSADRELVIRRTTERDEPRRDDFAVSRVDDRREYRETRYRDDFEVVSPTRGSFDDRDRDLQRYTRNTEYFAPAPPPQTIIIRQEPIIIRERVRDDDYQIVRKSDVDEERSVARREPDRPREREEDYFYEKKIRERIDEPSRKNDRDRDRDRDREDDYYERRTMRRELSPHDSVSQAGGRGRDDYSSDDSMVYVRRTREYDDDSDGGSQNRRKNLAAGVIAGVGAAELLRSHKKKEGRETSHGVGRVGRDIGAGAIGAIAAEGISRARSRHRSKSRRRGRSESRSRSRSRRRSRSESRSKLKTLGVVGLGAVALAAAAAVAQRKMGNKDESPNRERSSSRGRNQSVSELANDPTADDARNPKHRNIRMAEAGAAGAVVTALIDRARSKSRGRNGERERSRSRIRQAVPVVAAGLGSAALAGLYERNKAKKEATTIVNDERRRSRSRSRHGSEYFDGPREGAISEPGLIEYGDGPMYGNNYGEGYYGRPAPQEGFYPPQTAVVPAAPVAPGYGAAREARSRSPSLSRDRQNRRSNSMSSSSSQGRRGGSRRRSRDAAAAAGAAGAIAATEHERRKQEKRERKARRRQQEAHGHDPYEDAYNPTSQQPYTPTPPPPPGTDPYAAQPSYYPQTSQFPPPPGSVPQQYPATAQTAPPGGFNPHDFPPPPTGQPGVPGYDPYAPVANPYAPRTRGADENVSPFGTSFQQSTPNQHHVVGGLNGAQNVPPSIYVQPPSVSSTLGYPSLPDNQPTYIPPTERPASPSSKPRSVSQSPLSGHRKSVQFAEKPDIQPVALESEASSPEQPYHRNRERTARGYEAGDDTDSTPDDMRRRSRASGDLDTDSVPGPSSDDRSGRKRNHYRRRSHEPSSSSRTAPSSAGPSERVTSPAESDATVELPSRFDDKGKKKAEPGEDPFADKIDEIIAGRGAAGKVFGNFMDGLFGPGGRTKGGR